MAAVNRPKATALVLGCDRLPGEADPYECLDCLTERDACAFHAGFADGWDACMAAVAAWVNRDD
jgi:hypothetical protein